MATLITTRNFIDTLFVESEKSINHRDLFDFIQNDFRGYDLVCDLKCLDEYIEAARENPIWEAMMDKYVKITFETDVNDKVVDKYFYNSIGEQNIFLVDIDENDCKKLTDESGYLYIPISNITPFWDNIRLIRDHKKFKVTSDSIIPESMRFTCWSKVLDLDIPLTSVIIFDRYILKDESDKSLSDNLFKILERLCKNTKLDKQLNLTVISELKSDQEILHTYSKIESFLKSKSFLNVKLNVIKHHKSFYPKNFEGLHYRLIITNYFKIKCDDSFNFFKRNGKVHNDADLYISFNLNACNKPFYDKEIKDIKSYISKLKNHPPEVSLSEKIFYYHDKQNYLLN